MRLITERVLASGGRGMRELLPDTPLTRQKLRGSAADVSARLSKPEALQTALLGKDMEIVAILDELIDRKDIFIPGSEVRSGREFPAITNWLGVVCECSSLGVQVTSRRSTEPLARLRRLIVSLYSSESDKKQLAWILGRSEALGSADGDGLGKELETFMLEHTPSQVLKELVFCSHEKLSVALRHLRCPPPETTQTTSGG